MHKYRLLYMIIFIELYEKEKLFVMEFTQIV